MVVHIEPMKKKFVQVDDIKTCYYEGGQGKTLLVLHGWGIDSSKYLSLFEILEKDFHIVALDFPGFGESEQPTSEWGVSEYKHFVLKFLDAVNVNHFYVLAHSFGGRVAIKLGAEDRERIDKMVLTGAAGIRPKKSLKRKIFGLLASAGKKIFSIPFVSSLSRPAKKLLYKFARETDYMKASGIMKPIFSKVVAEDLTPYLKDVRPKVLLLWGEDDKMTPMEDGKMMEQKMPFADLMIYDGVGHRLPYERPDEISLAIKEFLG